MALLQYIAVQVGLVNIQTVNLAYIVLILDSPDLWTRYTFLSEQTSRWIIIKSVTIQLTKKRGCCRDWKTDYKNTWIVNRMREYGWMYEYFVFSSHLKCDTKVV